MTFTYSFNPATDLTRLRFHIGDTDSNNPIYQDDELNFLLGEFGTYQAAAIQAIDGIIAKVSQERNFQADWLRVDPASALDSYRKLRKQKCRLFGIPDLPATAIHVWRPDSGQSGPPDYTNIESGAYDDFDNPFGDSYGWGL